MRSCLLCVCVRGRRSGSPLHSRAFSLRCADLLLSRSAKLLSSRITRLKIKEGRCARHGAESEDIHPAPNCRAILQTCIR